MSVKTYLKQFKSLVPPPPNPMGIDTEWEQVESHLGVGLPTDYKEFISLYGTGSLQRFIHIWNFSDSRSTDPLVGIAQVFAQLKYYRESEKCDEFEAFPNVNGLLPFASTDDGNYLFWKMNGKPRNWEVAAYDFSSGTILYAPNLGMVNCLLRLVQKDNPFGDRFCNVENFNPPIRYKPFEG